MTHLPQAAVSRVGHQDMAHHPCSRVPSVSGLFDPVLVAGHRGVHAEPPLEGRLAGDTAQLGRALDGDVAAHVPDEEDPGGERFAAVLEDGAGEGGESLAAAAAAPPRDAGAETRAFKDLPIRRAAPVATATQVGGLSEQKELVGDEARHEYPEGVRSSHI